ncbi:hypothetical protein P8452_60444 [Trifolium repens]|nr:hypothetical protein P8452_60444 [Trifolium repens]
MARAIDFIKDINDEKELWKLIVCLEDVWKTGIGQGEHLEFLILDKQGDTIQVVLPSDLYPLFESKLEEGTTYIMKNFKVQPNDLKVKFCTHPFTLVAVRGDGGSDIIPTKVPNIPSYKFNFKSFDDIKNGKYRHDLLVGAVYDVQQDKRGFTTKKLPTTFSLVDASMNILTCSLWGKYQTEFLEKYNELAGEGPVIVILKHAAIREPQGIYELQVTNAWSGTKLIMDPDFKEVKDYKTSSQYSAGSRYAFRAPVTHISQLITLPEEEIVTTVATPHHVCISKNGWFYKSCAECPKALITDTPPYKCKVDSHVTIEPVIKYRLEAEVRFEGHKARFLFWDRECTELIGKTAAELQTIMLEAGEFDPREYPVNLDDITGTELAFKIPSLLALIAPIIGESSQLMLEDVPETSDIAPFHTQDLSATGESDPDFIKMHTPAKRSGEDSPTDEPTSAKLSSNKIMFRTPLTDLTNRLSSNFKTTTGNCSSSSEPQVHTQPSTSVSHVKSKRQTTNIHTLGINLFSRFGEPSQPTFRANPSELLPGKRNFEGETVKNLNERMRLNVDQHTDTSDDEEDFDNFELSYH